MDAPSPEPPGDTAEWWDDQLAHCWERNGGPAQTRHFMERLLAHLGEPERAVLRAGGATVLDWGCAMGEGVAVLAAAFPRAQVSGADIAPSAIGVARRRHPGPEFLVATGVELPRAFDAVVTSNCLEHFADPWSVVATHLSACRRFCAALVPYRELPRLDGHRQTFTEDSFPVCMAGWVRLYAREVSVDRRVWSGAQLLVVYGSPAHVAARGAAGAGEPWWASYLDGDPVLRRLVDDLALQRARTAGRAWEAEMLAGDGAGSPEGAELRRIAGTRAWRVAEGIWRWRRRLAPPASTRDRLLRRLLGTRPASP